MNEPRIISLAGTPHPKALIADINPGTGVFGFRWLNAAGNAVDSGGSVGTFTPQIGATQPDGSILYDETPDAVLIDAVENPPPVAVPVPQEVTRRQLLLALHAVGITRAQIAAQVAGDSVAVIEYEEALTFRRDHPLIGVLGAALQMGSEQIDDLFRAAARR